MSQLTIEDAIAAGQESMQECVEHAEELGFSTDAAKAFVLNWLAEYGPSWGEDIVDAAEKTHRLDLRVHDARAWGSVFSGLARQHKIRTVEIGLRRKGKGTAGARRWSLVQ